MNRKIGLVLLTSLLSTMGVLNMIMIEANVEYIQLHYILGSLMWMLCGITIRDLIVN